MAEVNGGMVRFIIAAALALTALGPAHEAWAQQPAPVVLYSYSKLTLGNDTQYVLVPMPSRKLKAPPSQTLLPAIVNGAFKELRDRKRTTYGSTSLDVSNKSLARGQATVKLDKEREKYHPIIVSEIVYTLTQLGLEEVNFPGHSKKALKRSDVPFAAYHLKVPAKRALPPKRIPTATIIMPKGEEISSDAYNKMVSSRDPRIIEMLAGYLKDKDLKMVKAAIDSVTSLKYDKGPDMILPLLKHKSPEIRTAALDALASNERPDVLDAISTVMDKDRDKNVALKASGILGASKNKKYSVRALFFALRGDQEGPAIKAIEALSKSKEPTVAAELVKAANSKNAKIATAAIKALANLKLTAELLAIFENKKQQSARRLQAAVFVAKLGNNEQKFKALTFQISNAEGKVALTALNALAGFKDPDPRTSIEAALSHPDIKVRHDAAARLGKIMNPESLVALAKAGARAEDAEIIQSVSSKIMAKLTLGEVLQYTSNRNIILQRVAYLALGVKSEGGGGGNKVFDALKKGVKSKDAGIRGASVRALGAFKNKRALDLVLSLSKDSDSPVRRDVARALSNWPSGTQTEILMAYLTDGQGEVIEAAVDALRIRKEDSAYKSVLKLTRGQKQHPHAGVRAAVYKALVVLAPKKELDTVISTVSGGLFDKERDVKLLSIKLLGVYDSPLAVTSLAALINDPVEEYRVKSLLALGNTGSKDAIELITSVFTDKSINVRVAAMTALGDTGEKSAIESIKMQLAVESEPAVVKAGEASLKKLK